MKRIKLNFKEVIPAAQAGDKKARDALMTQFYAWTVVQAKAVTRNSEIAKDTAVSVWEWLYTNHGIQKFVIQPSGPSFFSWLRGVVRNFAKRELTAHNRDNMQLRLGGLLEDYEDVEDDTEPGGDPLGFLEGQAAITAISDELTSVPRDVFWLLLDGETAEEIAEELGYERKVVNKIIRHVVAVAKRHVKGAEE